MILFFTYLQKRRSRKSLSATDLEVLALQLSENYLYEEAYRCALQVQLLKRLKDLGEKKHALLQSELLDDVGRVSGEIAHLTRELSSPAEEEHWQNMIQNSSKGETLTDISTFVTDVNREKGEQFRKKFVHGMPPSSAPLIDRMKYFVVAKRSAKMIATVCTSHLQRPPQWMKLVSSVQQTVQQGIDMLTSYSKLSPHEQSAIKTHSKMSEYLEGILAIVEAGLLISVSCVEAMEHEAVAKNVFATCHLLLSEVQKYFGLKDKVRHQVTRTMFFYVN